MTTPQFVFSSTYIVSTTKLSVCVKENVWIVFAHCQIRTACKYFHSIHYIARLEKDTLLHTFKKTVAEVALVNIKNRHSFPVNSQYLFFRRLQCTFAVMPSGS